MIWRSKAPQYEDTVRYWRRTFLLWPRTVEGYKVWLETVELSREFDADSWVFRWYGEKLYCLTEKQKIRIGEKW